MEESPRVGYSVAWHPEQVLSSYKVTVEAVSTCMAKSGCPRSTRGQLLKSLLTQHMVT